jgi:hypothetical protein
MEHLKGDTLGQDQASLANIIVSWKACQGQTL